MFNQNISGVILSHSGVVGFLESNWELQWVLLPLALNWDCALYFFASFKHAIIHGFDSNEDDWDKTKPCAEKKDV